MGIIPSRNEWIFSHSRNILEDKKSLIELSIKQMLSKAISIFKYNGLPDTITSKDIEIYNLVGGFSIWAKVNGELYVFSGGLGGEPNPYYLPTIATVANPALRFSENLVIGKDCIVMLNDYWYSGLMPLFDKYGSLLANAEITLKYALINARIPTIVEADNDNTRKSAEEFFKQVVDGKGFGIVGSKEFFDGVNTHDYFKQSNITDIIEAIQYIKGSWYNEIGLNAQFNMKREAINEAEALLNDDVLYPTVDIMLECRKQALEKINSMFGTNITVELNGVWKDNRIVDKLSIEHAEAELDVMKDGAEK